MNELIGTVDWSRAQFALTAMYHWLFVPLTIGLSLIVAIMESIYVRTGKSAWKGITKFWMTLFGINFACGVATGLILEFEFGTNWSNYSWFVGDIFGAPLAIEGLFAFFLEATFVAVMFFGWKKVSPKMHLAATWLTAFGVSLSAWWILVANSWMQYPVGMEFDPEQMRNVMDDFWAVAFSPVAVNKFFHAVFSGWALAGVFVVGISFWMLFKKRNVEASIRSVKVAGWVGFIGILMTMYTGHGSAVQVSRVQPMKLAAMEGLFDGGTNQGLVAFGIYDDEAAKAGEGNESVKARIEIPSMLSLLVNMSTDTYVPGINDLIAGRQSSRDGKMVQTESYAERIEMGKKARVAIADYNKALKADDKAALADAKARINENYKYFGYGFLDDAQAAVPPVGMSFYAFHIMVILGGYLLLFFVIVLALMYKRPALMEHKWICILGVLTIPAVWICSQAGWVLAEVGRQPWVIQDLMPTGVAVSDISSGSVQLTFWIFASLFTGLLVAEISILLVQIRKRSKADIQQAH